jgi:hypothetical protein
LNQWFPAEKIAWWKRLLNWLNRVWMIEWNKRQSYIRFYPNPGFKILGKHWSRYHRKRTGGR